MPKLISNLDNLDMIQNGETSGKVVVLEASTDNVIDFNSLTEPGYYLIKNCSDGVGTTLNSGVYGTTTTGQMCDVMLEVRTFSNAAGTKIIYQMAKYLVYATSYYRTYQTAWSEWKKSNPYASDIAVGTFASGMKCNTPTEGTHLANKSYVDTQVATKANTSHTQAASTITSGTFPSGISCKTPTADAHLANKAYVDSKASGGRTLIASKTLTAAASTVTLSGFSLAAGDTFELEILAKDHSSGNYLKMLVNDITYSSSKVESTIGSNYILDYMNRPFVYGLFKGIVLSERVLLMGQRMSFDDPTTYTSIISFGHCGLTLPFTKLSFSGNVSGSTLAAGSFFKLYKT